MSPRRDTGRSCTTPHHTVLHVHRADRADALVAALGGLLAARLDDVFSPDLVSVPTRGVERWLTQRLSGILGASDGRGDGVVANVAFPSPRQIVDEAVAAASGIDPRADLWLPERVVWPLLEVVDDHLDEAWLSKLADHLRDSAGEILPDEPLRRFGAVRHLAHLFDRYAVHRPAMLRSWSAGHDVDATGSALPSDVCWQAGLWRHLRERIDQPSPAERLDVAVARLNGDASLADLPPRLSLFGLTRLPPGHLEVLRAIATHREVHLFLLHPSPALWDRVSSAISDSFSSPCRRADDPTSDLPENRLLASWGRDVRELQVVLGPAGGYEDHPVSGAQPSTTLLSRIQQSIREDASPPDPALHDGAEPRPLLEEADRSVEVHACHGRARQVEVLRDVVLHALQEDDKLQPRDIIVMCPDIEAFAPLIHATFGTSETSSVEPGPSPSSDEGSPANLRVRLADRALRQTNPVLGTIGKLLDLADQRLTASQVLDLCDQGPVRRRFALDDEALVRIEEWIAGTEIRWGLDAAHRAPFKLDKIQANTWRAGLDRILLGATMTEEDQRLVSGVLPLDDVDSGSIDLAGRFAELADRLTTIVDAFQDPKTIHQWSAAIAMAADLLTDTSPRDSWQRAALDRLLARIVSDSAVAATSAAMLGIAEVRTLLDEHVRGRPTRSNFRTGHLTICTLLPMRSVPHRVVCLLGLDDTVLPRKAPHDGDDLIVEDPHIGDHDGRTEDRQMLLDALMAAQDKLVITYTGHDERTNALRPPAVPVGELLDVVDRTVHTSTGAARDRIVVNHPLQPFNPRNFQPGALAGVSAWSFDRVMLNGARALSAERSEVPPFLSEPLPPLDTRVVELDDLARFVQHPARAFLRQRLGVSLADFSDEIVNSLPIELDALEAWGVGERLLRSRLAGESADAAIAAERARGAVPPGVLADAVLTSAATDVEAILIEAQAVLTRTTELDSVDVKVELADGRAISGTVGGLVNQTVQTVAYSRLGPKHRLAAWVRVLALTAAHPAQPFEAVTIGRRRSAANWRTTVSIAHIPPLGDTQDARRDAAHAHLAALLDLFDRGMREPPPLACATSAAYAAAALGGRNAAAAGGKEWESEFNRDREDKELEHQLLLGGVLAFDDLLSEPPPADEGGKGWPQTDATRFGRWALRLWTGLLSAEELSDR